MWHKALNQKHVSFPWGYKDIHNCKYSFLTLPFSQVSLEVDDLSDIEELEDLEEGRQHEQPEAAYLSEADTASTTSPSVLASPEHHHHHHHHHNGFAGEYIEDVLPMPYCGCEPLRCHLMSTARPFEDIIIDQVCTVGGKYVHSDFTFI